MKVSNPIKKTQINFFDLQSKFYSRFRQKKKKKPSIIYNKHTTENFHQRKKKSILHPLTQEKVKKFHSSSLLSSRDVIEAKHVQTHTYRNDSRTDLKLGSESSIRASLLPFHPYYYMASSTSACSKQIFDVKRDINANEFSRFCCCIRNTSYITLKKKKVQSSRSFNYIPYRLSNSSKCFSTFYILTRYISISIGFIYMFIQIIRINSRFSLECRFQLTDIHDVRQVLFIRNWGKKNI